MSKFPGRLVRFYSQTLVRKTAAALSAPLLYGYNHIDQGLPSPVRGYERTDGTGNGTGVRYPVRDGVLMGVRVDSQCWELLLFIPE